MKKNSISTWKIAATYIGTVVGAGFATGQEVLQFFASFRLNGLLGVLLTTGLFILFGIIIIELGFRLRANSHLEIVKHAGGKVYGSVMDIIITFFLFGSLTAMIAGTGALFSQQFGLSALLGNLIMAILAAMTVLTGINGVINSISMVVPFLLVSVAGISIFSIFKTPPDFTAAVLTEKNSLIQNWVLSAVLYTSYNTVGSIAMLGPLGAHAKDKKTIVRGGILGGLGLGLGSALIFFAISGNLAVSQDLEVPMAYIAGNISRAVQLIYAVILIAEIYTTAVGSLYGFAARMSNPEKSPKKSQVIIIATTVAAFFASLFGFSNLVKYLYPLVGYGGILLLICLLRSKHIAKKKKAS